MYCLRSEDGASCERAGEQPASFVLFHISVPIVYGEQGSLSQGYFSKCWALNKTKGETESGGNWRSYHSGSGRTDRKAHV